jgi:inositol oxygenase
MKEEKDFRVYAAEGGVFEHYKAMRQHQTLAFVERQEAKWGSFDKGRHTVREIFEVLKSYVDSSDPDTSHPNEEHMLQAAQAARESGAPRWQQFVCLVHDLGKFMFMHGTAEDGQVGRLEGPQWALGGDTWVVGCRIPDCAVLPQLNELNPDMAHPVYSTPHGVYEQGCGIAALKFAWGHDEYIYRWAVHNKLPLPEAGLQMLRLHSCYPLHSGGAYRSFLAPGDEETLEAVRAFNKFDLYTKSDARPDVEALWASYFDALVEEFAPGQLCW